MATKARLTAEDLWNMADGEARHELVNGEIIEMPFPGGIHGSLSMRIGHWLLQYVDRHGGGVVVGDAGFILNLPYDPERVRGPDVAFISAERLPGGQVPVKFFHGAPDLAVEVLSPSEKSIEVQQKVQDYLEGGARLVWVVAPQTRSVTVYRPDGSARLVRENEQLEGEDVLPGLTIPLAELFR